MLKTWLVDYDYLTIRVIVQTVEWFTELICACAVYRQLHYSCIVDCLVRASLSTEQTDRDGRPLVEGRREYMYRLCCVDHEPMCDM